MGKCKVCNEREAVASYRGKCLQCGRLYLREWRDKNREKSREYRRRWYEKHKNDAIIDNRDKPVPNRLAGVVGVCRAMQDGKLKVRECFDCGKMSSEYCELEDIWLCRSCHWKYH